MEQKKTKARRTNNTASTTGWLHVIESEPPRFFCPVFKGELSSPCELRGCLLWTSNRKVYCCAGAFGSMKASNSEERLQATSATQREKRGTLRSAAEGKLSFYDLAHLYGFSRQRVEGFVSYGRQIIETLAPLFAEVDVTGERDTKAATRRLGNPSLFTYTGPTAHVDDENGEVTRVCICCESIIEPDDNEMILAILDRSEAAWCSRECARELPIDAFLVSNRYKRHWVSVALNKDPVDERSRVREITPERMKAMQHLAVQQGYE